MPFCPRCKAEYAENVEMCVDCDVTLVASPPSSRLGPSFDLDFEDLLVPLGSFVVLFMAIGLLWIRYLATSGQIEPPLGPLILASQPQCFVIFYVVAAALSAGTLALALIRLVMRRR